VYTVTVPPDCVHGGCGLILDNHGATMNAAQQMPAPNYGSMAGPRRQYGAPTPFIVVQPNLTDLLTLTKLWILTPLSRDRACLLQRDSQYRLFHQSPH
jgi:hypothetical protein